MNSLELHFPNGLSTSSPFMRHNPALNRTCAKRRAVRLAPRYAAGNTLSLTNPSDLEGSMKRVTGIGGIFFKAKETHRHYTLGTSGISESMFRNGVARLSPGRTMKGSRLREQPSGPLVRLEVTSLPLAPQRSWSITVLKTCMPWSKYCAKKAATFSTR